MARFFVFCLSILSISFYMSMSKAQSYATINCVTGSHAFYCDGYMRYLMSYHLVLVMPCRFCGYQRNHTWLLPISTHAHGSPQSQPSQRSSSSILPQGFLPGPDHAKTQRKRAALGQTARDRSSGYNARRARVRLLWPAVLDHPPPVHQPWRRRLAAAGTTAADEDAKKG